MTDSCILIPMIVIHFYSVISTEPGWKPYRNVVLGDSIDAFSFGFVDLAQDTLKLYTKAHGAKV